MNGFIKWVYDIGSWLWKIMFLQMLWVAFTLAGLGLFGVFPATAAMFSVIHKWFDRDVDIPIYKNFIDVYKSYFMKANALGYILFAIGAFLYFDLIISKQYVGSFIVHFILLIICFIYFISCLYFFPVFIRYEMKTFAYYKQSLLIALSRPFETIAILVSLILLYYLFIYVPVLLFFIGAPLIATPIMWFSYRGFIQIEGKLG